MLNNTLNSKQTKIKQAIFAQPTPKNLIWNEVVSLLKAVGCTIVQRQGSSVAFNVGAQTFSLHRPHTENTIKAYQVQKIRNSLLQIGVMP